MESQDMSGVGIKGVTPTPALTPKEKKGVRGQQQVIDVGTFRFNSFDRKRRKPGRVRWCCRRSSTQGPLETHASEFGSGPLDTRMMSIRSDSRTSGSVADPRMTSGRRCGHTMCIRWM